MKFRFLTLKCFMAIRKPSGLEKYPFEDDVREVAR